MLVLTRSPGQRIVLPDLGITIQVSEVKGGKVRIGIDAPSAIRILREELLIPEHVVGRADSLQGMACPV